MFSSDPTEWLLAAASLAVVVVSVRQFRRSRRETEAAWRRYDRKRAASRALEEKVGEALRALKEGDRRS